jgi:phosphatidate cytidylyltransferase
LKQRIITALILAPLVILGIFCLPLPWFMLFIAAVTFIGFWEWTQFTDSASRVMALLPAIVVAGASAMVIPFDTISLNLVDSTHIEVLGIGAGWWILASGLALSFPKSSELWKNSKVLRHTFGMLTLIPFFWSIVILRAQYIDINEYYGAKLVMFVCLIVWAADSGAYFAGKSFGKRKMAPNVSPNKTIEGLVGGIITALFIAWLAAAWFELEFSNTPAMIGITLVTVVISVLGDLVESMFKRVSKIKDSSNIIPGHGGVLDRIDSLTAAFPVFALLYLVF